MARDKFYSSRKSSVAGGAADGRETADLSYSYIQQSPALSDINVSKFDLNSFGKTENYKDKMFVLSMGKRWKEQF